MLYLLDGKNASAPTDRTNVTLRNVALGTHLVRAMLVQHDGTPVDPPAFADRLVRVVPPPTPPPPTPESSSAPSPSTPSKTPGPPLSLELAVALALAHASRSRRRS